MIAKAALVSSLYRSIADRQNFPRGTRRFAPWHGPGAWRTGRFGSTVNIAARVAAQAVGGQILCTQHVADTLKEAKGLDVDVEIWVPLR